MEIKKQMMLMEIIKTEIILKAYLFIKRCNQQQHSDSMLSESTLSVCDKLQSINNDNILLEILSNMSFEELREIFEAPRAAEIQYYAKIALSRQLEKETEENKANIHAFDFAMMNGINPGAMLWRRIADTFCIGKDTTELVKLIRMRLDETKTLSSKEQPDNTLSETQLSLLSTLLSETSIDTTDNCKINFFARVALAKSIGHTYLTQAAEVFGKIYCAKQLTEWEQELQNKTAKEIFDMIKKIKKDQEDSSSLTLYQRIAQIEKKSDSQIEQLKEQRDRAIRKSILEEPGRISSIDFLLYLDPITDEELSEFLCNADIIKFRYYLEYAIILMEHGNDVDRNRLLEKTRSAAYTQLNDADDFVDILTHKIKFKNYIEIAGMIKQIIDARNQKQKRIR